MSTETHRIYRCAIDLQVPPTARNTLLRALREEGFALRHHVPWEALEASVRSGRFRVHYMENRPWVGFESDLLLLSTRLRHTLVRGVSVVEIQNDEGRTLEVLAEKIVARRGESVRIPLQPRLQGGEYVVDDDRDDLEAIQAQWPTYPEWARNALRNKYPAARPW